MKELNYKKISVIIPIYNGEKTLKECLSSVTNQNYSNYEIIIVDNNSTDNTKKIIGDYSIVNKNIKYVFEGRKGRGAARNTGINNSTGEIIVMTDSDCIVPINWLEEITKPIREEKERVVMGLEENILNNYWSNNIQINNNLFFRVQTKEKYINFIDTKNFAIETSLIKKYMFDENLKSLEDFDLFFRIKNSNKIRLLSNIKVKHMHKNSFISWSKLQIERGFWAYKIYKKYYKNNDIKKEEMMKSISIKNILIFPLWLVKQSLTKPIKKLPFIFISEVSWRIGLVIGIIKK